MRLVGACMVVALFTAGCATQSHRVVERPAPSVMPVRERVTSARTNAQKAVESTQRAQTAIGEGKTLTAQLAASANEQSKPVIMKLQSAQALVESELSLAREQLKATVDALTDALLESDTLEKQVAQQTDDLNQSRQTIADQQEIIARVEKHDAATAASNRKLIVKIMIYRCIAAIFAGWIASKFFPAFFPQFKLYAALGVGALSLGCLCWAL